MSWKIISIGFLVAIIHILLCQGSLIRSNIGLTNLNLKRFARSPLSERIWKRSDTSEAEYEDNYYQEPEERECEDEYFWHIRGFKCVPFKCPDGTKRMYTGECVVQKSRILENVDNRNRQIRPLNRGKTQSKYRIPYGVTLKG